MTDIVRIKSRLSRARRDARPEGDSEPAFLEDRRARRRLAAAPGGEGGTLTVESGEYGHMSVRPALSPCPRTDSDGADGNGRPRSAAGLDPAVDFERYREPATKRFIAMARAMGQHTFHDLDELAADFYDEFWAEWLERPGKEFSGSATPYIAGAMMNKLRDLSRRGRSVRAPELLRSECEEILATVAAEELEPAEQLVLQEEMWQVNEIVHSLPAREQVAFAAVFARDSKKKDAPLAGYKLAASRLGVSEARAKKLSLAANKRIRAAVEQSETGSWCERWARSIELVAAGGEGEQDFLRHAEHCVQCRLGVAHLRRQAAILPLPTFALAAHAHVLPRLWRQLRSGWTNARHQLGLAVGRHASTAADAGGMVGTGGGAAGAGFTAFKLGAVCLGVGLTGAGASVCLTAAGLPSPIISAITGSGHTHKHRPGHRGAGGHFTGALAQSVTVAPPIRAVARVAPETVSHPHTVSKSTSAPRRHSPAQQSASAAQAEFNPGGGSGTPISSSGSETSHSSTSAQVASNVTATPASKPAHHASSTSGTVTSGQSNAFTAP